MDINVSYYSGLGTRENNEDCVSLQECCNGLLALVADGLGGHAKGEVASNLATSTINQMLANKDPNETDLVNAIQCASDVIYKAQDDKSQMKTTIAAVWIGDYMAVVANVGDSRIYQFRNGQIVYQTVDHSMAQMAVLIGEMSVEDIRTSQDRNKLIRVLGGQNAPKVDCEILSIQKGDRLLICSDGFWEPVDENMMISAMNTTSTAKEWLEKMKKVIELSGSTDQDNHTAIAILINE